VALVPLAFISAYNTANATPFLIKTFYETDSYDESFTTTTYQNLSQTTAIGWGSGSLTNSRMYSVQLLDTFPLPGAVRSIDVQGRTLYVSVNLSTSTNAFRIFNINNPKNIKLMNSLGTWSFQEPIEVSGDIAAMAGGPVGGQGVGFYNVTYPYAPVMGPFVLFDGNLTDLEFHGHYLYVANYDSPSSQSFQIIDLENPNSPVLLPMSYSSPNVRGLAVCGHFAYLAEGPAGLRIMNISAPTSPSLVDTVNTPGNAMDIIVDGGRAFVADGSGGVQIVDISNPNSATIIGSYNTAGIARKLALQGDTLLVADSSNGLVVLDVANPAQPILVDTIAISYVWDVDLYGEIVCVGGNAGIYTYQIGYGISLLPIIGVYDGGFEIKDVRVQGEIAYVAAGADGVLTIDVSDPAAPVLLDQYTAGIEDAIKLDVQGYIAIVLEDAEVHILNVINPSNIRLYQNIPAYQMTDVFFFGELCFYSFSTGAGWVNVSNPYAFHYYQKAFGTNVTAIWVQGTYLYAVEDIGGFSLSFYIYDISDLNNWRLIESRMRVAYHSDIFVDGDVAYLADDDPGISGYASLYNITDPFNTFLTQDFFNNTRGLCAYGPWLVTADQTQGVSLHNTSDINSPTTLITRTDVNAAWAVTIHGNYAYIANSTSLVILQLVSAAGNSYNVGTNLATSTEIDSITDPSFIIRNATLIYSAIEPAGTTITFEMSADGGNTWEAISPGSSHIFTIQGNDLRWRTNLTTTLPDRSILLESVSITYSYELILTPSPILYLLIIAAVIGIIIVVTLVIIIRRRKQTEK
jgi:hypothetical protein